MGKKIMMVALLFACSLAVYFVVDAPSKCKLEEVTYADERVSLDDIDANQVVLIKRELNFAWGYEDSIFMINKKGQAKFVDLSMNDNLIPKDLHVMKNNKELITFCDNALSSQKIPYEKKKLDVSDWMLGEVLNVSDFKEEGTQNYAMDAGTSTIYSVCGSGENRKLVKMSCSGNSKLNSRNKKIVKLCDDIRKLHYAILVTHQNE